MQNEALRKKKSADKKPDASFLGDVKNNNIA